MEEAVLKALVSRTTGTDISGELTSGWLVDSTTWEKVVNSKLVGGTPPLV